MYNLQNTKFVKPAASSQSTEDGFGSEKLYKLKR